MANFIPPPQGPFKNSAQYTSAMHNWIFDQMRRGWTMDEIWAQAQQYPESAFKKGGAIWNGVIYNSGVFPGADGLYEYDLTGKQKKLREYTSNEGTKGPGQWEPMTQDEINRANEYYNLVNQEGLPIPDNPFSKLEYYLRQWGWDSGAAPGFTKGNQFSRPLSGGGGQLSNNGQPWKAGAKTTSTTTNNATAQGVKGRFVQMPDGTWKLRSDLGSSFDLSAHVDKGGTYKDTTMYKLPNGTYSMTAPAASSSGVNASSIGVGDPNGTIPYPGGLTIGQAMANGMTVEAWVQSQAAQRQAELYAESRPIDHYLSDFYGDIMGVSFPRADVNSEGLLNMADWLGGSPGQPGGPPGNDPNKPVPNPNPNPNRVDLEDQPSSPPGTIPGGGHEKPGPYPAFSAFQATARPDANQDGVRYLGPPTPNDAGSVRFLGPPSAAPGVTTSSTPQSAAYIANSAWGALGDAYKAAATSTDSTASAPLLNLADYLSQLTGTGTVSSSSVSTGQVGSSSAAPGTDPLNQQYQTMPQLFSGIPRLTEDYSKKTSAFNPYNPNSWALLAAPASQIAGDLDANKAQILRSMPRGGERNLAMSQAINQGYGKVAGLRQGLVRDALGSLSNMSSQKMFGTAMPPFQNMAGSAAGAASSNYGTDIDYLKAIKTTGMNNDAQKWAAYMSMIGGLVPG